MRLPFAHSRPFRRGRRAYLLLEALLALAIFALVVVGIARVLNRAVANARETRLAAAVVREMENLMEQTLHQPEMEPGLWEEQLAPEESGLPVPVYLETEIIEAEMENQDGQPLGGLFEVTLRLEALDNREESKVWELRTLVYPPLYQRN